MNTDSFYVVAREPGAENPSLPTWANHNANPAALDENGSVANYNFGVAVVFVGRNYPVAANA
jgi:hypothetical protein